MRQGGRERGREAERGRGQEGREGRSAAAAQTLSHFPLFAARWAVAHQAPLSMEFFWQEYWSGVPFPLPGEIPDPGIKPVCLGFAGKFFTTGTTWQPRREDEV